MFCRQTSKPFELLAIVRGFGFDPNSSDFQSDAFTRLAYHALCGNLSNRNSYNLMYNSLSRRLQNPVCLNFQVGCKGIEPLLAELQSEFLPIRNEHPIKQKNLLNLIKRFLYKYNFIVNTIPLVF